MQFFRSNRFAVIAISDKPTSMKPLVKNKNEKNEELVILQQKLDTLTMLPKKKYNYPMTSAQEIGWDMDTEFGVYKPKYQFSKTECAECKYANDYVTMTKRSPYAAKRPEAANPSPTKK
jgi:hypothetical protein